MENNILKKIMMPVADGVSGDSVCRAWTEHG